MTDHKDEATFHGGELPRREPFETLASWDRQAQPAPPVNPGRPHQSPGTPPWGSLSQDIGHVAPRKRRVWPWVLVAVVLVLGCGVGGLVLVGAGGKAVVDTVNDQATARAAEIKITSCTGPDEFGMVTVKYTIHNGSDQVQSYLPQFDLGDGKGMVYGQAADIVNNLAAGKDYKGSAANVVQAPKGAKIVCSVTGA
jgi:hypothetical protein